MSFRPKIVLHCASGYHREIDHLVRQFPADGVRYVGIVGQDCEHVKSRIDALLAELQPDASQRTMTLAHPRVSLAGAIAFAIGLDGRLAGAVQVVRV